MTVYVEPNAMKGRGEGDWRVSRVGNTISTHRSKSTAKKAAKRAAQDGEQVAVNDGGGGGFSGIIPGAGK